MKKKIDLNNICPSSLDRIVALEVNNDGTASCFQKGDDNLVIEHRINFKPFLLVHGEKNTNITTKQAEVIALQGNGFYNYQLNFDNLEDLKEAEKEVKKNATTNAYVAPYRFFTDRTSQALMANQIRLFRNMQFEEIHRLQLDIETKTTENYNFPNAEREGDEIIIISLSDSTGWELCLSNENGEKKLLEDMVKVIKERDPDVIEGHNICNFDLPYIEKRAKMHKVKLNLGRDNSIIKKRASRMNIAENTINYTRYEIYGRHIVDTLHLVQLFDISSRSLDSYGLKSVAKFFGVAAPVRTYIEGDKITQIYNDNPELLKKYAMDDVRETNAISKITSPSYFYQAQIIPLSYQNCIVRGNASRIDTILVAEYLQKKYALPLPQAAKPYQGGLTESIEAQVVKNIWHMDIQSLYPSIIIAYDLNPKKDELKIFSHYLKTLRLFRLEAKQAAKDSQGNQKEYLNTLQKTFKILINSFYGYTGFSQGTFNDYTMAETITATGRNILLTMRQALTDNNARILEMDTDGIYFVPPQNVTTDDLQAKIQQALPNGIEVELDSTYQAMLCYKSKNYALLQNDGKIAITGAALKSRGLEQYLRDYLHKIIEFLLNDKSEEIAKLTEEILKQLDNHEIPLNKLSKRETMSTSIDSYKKNLIEKKGRRTAVMELAMKNTHLEYKQGDHIIYYVTGTKKNVSIVDNSKLVSENNGERDENTLFYKTKIIDYQQKFSPFITSNQEEKKQTLFDF